MRAEADLLDPPDCVHRAGTIASRRIWGWMDSLPLDDLLLKKGELGIDGESARDGREDNF